MKTLRRWVATSRCDVRGRRSAASLPLLLLLASCELARYNAPPVAASSGGASAAELRRGRSLYAYRCIECHALPPVWRYSNDEWPRIVDSMAHRAALKPDERDAILAYIRAARGD